MSEFTHFNRQGEAVMVDVSAKTETAREAVAEGRISMSRECFEKVKEGEMGKGDVLAWPGWPESWGPRRPPS